MGASAFGSGAVAVGEFSTASGYNAVAAEKWSSAYGVGSQATGQSATAIGGQMIVINGSTWEEESWSTEASGQESTAIGTAARATSYGSTALGVVSEASGESATAIGQASTARGDESVAIGGQARAYDVFSTAIGRFSGARPPRRPSALTAFGASAIARPAIGSDSRWAGMPAPVASADTVGGSFAHRR